MHSKKSKVEFEKTLGMVTFRVEEAIVEYNCKSGSMHLMESRPLREHKK